MTVAEVMKTLSTNAATSKAVTTGILDAVHAAVASGTALTRAKGGMEYSICTPKSEWSDEAKKTLGYILPQYFL